MDEQVAIMNKYGAMSLGVRRLEDGPSLSCFFCTRIPTCYHDPSGGWPAFRTRITTYSCSLSVAGLSGTRSFASRMLFYCLLCLLASALLLPRLTRQPSVTVAHRTLAPTISPTTSPTLGC